MVFIHAIYSNKCHFYLYLLHSLWFFKTTGDSRLMALNLKARLSSKNLIWAEKFYPWPRTEPSVDKTQTLMTSKKSQTRNGSRTAKERLVAHLKTNNLDCCFWVFFLLPRLLQRSTRPFSSSRA